MRLIKYIMIYKVINIIHNNLLLLYCILNIAFDALLIN